MDDPKIKKQIIAVRKSLAELKRHEQKIEQHKENIEIYKEAMQRAKLEDKDLFPEVMERIQKNTGVNSRDAFQMPNRRSPEAEQAYQQLVKESSDRLFNVIKAERAVKNKQRAKHKNAIRK